MVELDERFALWEDSLPRTLEDWQAIAQRFVTAEDEVRARIDQLTRENRSLLCVRGDLVYASQKKREFASDLATAKAERDAEKQRADEAEKRHRDYRRKNPDYQRAKVAEARAESAEAYLQTARERIEVYEKALRSLGWEYVCPKCHLIRPYRGFCHGPFAERHPQTEMALTPPAPKEGDGD